MSTVEERVIGMKFDNKQFLEANAATLAALDALNKGLKLDGATKGLTDVSNAAKNVSLANIEHGVTSLADRFRMMSVVALTALTNIANKAVDAGLSVARSLTIGPIKQGLEEYEDKLTSIKTILANTAKLGTNLEQVTKALNELNAYSDQTIYSFSEMTRSVKMFTTAGISLDVSVASIKGLANVAALTGTNATDAARAMYQMSLALSSGSVRLQDWISLESAGGMAGKIFQDSLIETAKAHGTNVDAMIKKNGSFRNSLAEGWLTTKVLTETLSKFTGDLNDKQLKALGYTKEQIVAIQKMAKMALSSAQDVKTMTALFDTLKESAGSGWAQTWEILFGNVDEATTLWSGLNRVIGGYINASSEMRNEVLGDWKELGGRTVIIDAITNAFDALISIARPIRDAFNEIFPAITGKRLYEISVAIRNFTEGLELSGGAADKLRRTFAGVFAVFGIVWDLVSEAAKVLFRLFGIATEGSGSFLEVTAKIGDFLVALRQAIQDGEGFAKVFGVIGHILEVPIKILRVLIGLVGSLFSNFDPQAAVKGLTGLVGKFEPLTRLGEVIATVWGKVISLLDDAGVGFAGLGAKIAHFFGDFGSYISEAVSGIDFGDLLSGINTGLFAGLVLMIRNIFGKGGAGGLIDGIKDSFDQLTGTMKTMQNTLRAATLLQIALAIGVLTVSVNTLSKIDAAGLTRALTAITVMFGQLLGALLLFEKMSGFTGLAKMPLVTGALVLLGIAINVLALAVKNLAGLSWDELARGLTGVTVLLGVLIATVALMPPAPGMIASSTALILLAAAVKILASAVTDLAVLSWEDLAKGLLGVGAVLGALTLFSKFAKADATGVLSGAGIILLAVGLKIVASAMKDFAGMSWEEIGKGLVGMAGALTLITAALILLSDAAPTAPLSAGAILIVAISLGMIADAVGQMGGMDWGEIGKGLVVLAGALTLITLALVVLSDAAPTAPLSAGAILIVAISLGMIADAIGQMGGMSWEAIAKGLVVLAASLTIITLAMIFMTGALPGAAALLVVAGALAILAPILQLFGQMSWSEMGKGLLMLAGIFLVLGVAGALLTPVIPTLLGLGLAIALIGVGLALAGVGILAFSVAVTALSLSGAALVTAIVAIVSGLIGLIPALAEQIGLGLVVIAGVIANAGPAILKAIVTVLTAIIEAIITVSPKIAAMLLVLIDLMIKVLIDAVPKLAQAGYEILIGVLTAIRNNIRKVVDVSLEIVAQFIKGLGDGLPKVLTAGAQFIIKFINGLADTIRNNSEALGKAGGNLATAIIEGMAKGLLGGSSVIANAAKNVAKNALKAAMDILGINSPSKEFEKIGKFSDEGMAQGLDKYSKLVTASAAGVGEDAMLALKTTIRGLGDGLSTDMDLSPTIRPVLDLSSIRRDADAIGSMFRTEPIVLDASIRRAKDAADGFQTNKDISDENADESGGDQFTFNQYNNSPKELSTADIYRQTNNQLSQAKEAVAP